MKVNIEDTCIWIITNYEPTLGDTITIYKYIQPSNDIQLDDF